MGRGAALSCQLPCDEAARQDAGLTLPATRIRLFRDDDVRATAQIFFDAVRLGSGAYYDDAQRRAWAPCVPETSVWLDRLKRQKVFVAERDGVVVGFMTLAADGCIDLAYVAPDMIGQGVARRLYDAIVSEALATGVRRLFAEASHMACAFFERQGWSVIKPQTVSRGGVSMPNFLMEKPLP